MDSERELQRVLGVPDHIWLGQIQLDQSRPELGVGSDAVVHRTDYDGFHVAAKVLHHALIAPGNPDRQVFIRRFGEECRLLRQLNHANIVGFIGVGQVPNGCPCLIVELMEGSLASRIGARPADSLLQSLSYMIDITAGLRYLHWLEIVHRDLKPRNVLITAGAAKIADVGLARSLHGDDLPQQQSRCPGTPHYMAPETLDEGRRYDQSLDIFSGGVILLALISNKEPAPKARRIHHRADGSQVATSELDRRRDDISLLDRQHPARRLIVRCISDDPSQRPSAAEFHEGLRRIQQSFIGAEKAVLSSEHAQTVTRLNSTQQQLASTRQELASTREQLVATRQELTSTQQEQTSTQETMARLTSQMAELSAAQQQLSSFRSTTQQALTRNQQAITELQVGIWGRGDTEGQFGAFRGELEAQQQRIQDLAARVEGLTAPVAAPKASVATPKASVAAATPLLSQVERHDLFFDSTKCSSSLILLPGNRRVKCKGRDFFTHEIVHTTRGFASGRHRWGIKIHKVGSYAALVAGVAAEGPPDEDIPGFALTYYLTSRRAYCWTSDGFATGQNTSGEMTLKNGNTRAMESGDVLTLTLDCDQGTLGLSLHGFYEHHEMHGLVCDVPLYPFVGMLENGVEVELC